MKDVRKSDNAVSEIIGAILLFAIASVLLTSFILWYVPSTGTNNDLSYQGGTQNSFSSLDSKMLSSSLTPGSAI
jgi:archaeal flagellin N-terminal-like domain